jgi:hypothetical protein
VINDVVGYYAYIVADLMAAAHERAPIRLCPEGRIASPLPGCGKTFRRALFHESEYVLNEIRASRDSLSARVSADPFLEHFPAKRMPVRVEKMR